MYPCHGIIEGAAPEGLVQPPPTHVTTAVSTALQFLIDLPPTPRCMHAHCDVTGCCDELTGNLVETAAEQACFSHGIASTPLHVSWEHKPCHKPQVPIQRRGWVPEQRGTEAHREPSYLIRHIQNKRYESATEAEV